MRPEEGWSCDGGAAVLSDMLDRAGVDHRLRIGLYDPNGPNEEHHHWVEVGPWDDPEILLDPNGELRGEPFAQPIAPETAARYLARDDVGVRGDRELMSFSPLWDRDEQRVVGVEELEDHYDPGVLRYLEQLRR